MLSVFVITFPFFALIACGYGAAKWGMLPLSAIPGLNGFVLFFALPCLLYRLGATTPTAQLWMPEATAIYVLGALLVVSTTVWATVGSRGWNDAALGALVAAFPNSGFMGLPLLAALVGAGAAAPAMMVIAVDMVVTSSLCVALSRLGSPGEPHAPHALGRWMLGFRRAMAGVLRNPMPWAIGLGALTAMMQWHLPPMVDKTVGMLADAASPVALFTIGAVLARAKMQQTTLTHAHSETATFNVPLTWRGYVPIAVVKLVLHPCLIAILARAC